MSQSWSKPTRLVSVETVPIGWKVLHLGLWMIVAVGLRKLGISLGFDLPLREIAAIGNTASFGLITLGCMLLARNPRWAPQTSSYGRNVLVIFRFLLVCAFLHGLLRGNNKNDIANEAILLWSLASLTGAATNPLVFRYITRTITVIFWVVFPIICVNLNTPTIEITVDGISQRAYEEIDNRYIASLGYEFAVFTGTGIFLGVLGIVSVGTESRRVRLAQIAALLACIALDVIIFKFRGALVVAVLTMLSLTLLRPLLENRSRPSAFAIVMAIGACLAAALVLTEQGKSQGERWREHDSIGSRGIFASRNLELQHYIDNMGVDLLLGRGLGGAFDAYDAIRIEAAIQWKTLHYGILVFSLKGGVPLLLSFTFIFLKIFRLRHKQYYSVQENLAATLYAPVICFQVLLGPFALMPSAIILYIPAMLVFGRALARPEVIQQHLIRRSRIGA